MPTDPTFRMTIQDVFSIKGRGSVVTGQIESGTISAGDTVQIQGRNSAKTTTVSSLEIQRKVTTQAQRGDHVGILLKNIAQEDVQPGDILTGAESDFTWKP